MQTDSQADSQKGRQSNEHTHIDTYKHTYVHTYTFTCWARLNAGTRNVARPARALDAANADRDDPIALRRCVRGDVISEGMKADALPARAITTSTAAARTAIANHGLM